VGRLLALLALATGLALWGVSLSGPTALLLLPGHLLFAALVMVGATVEGWSGRPEAARGWLFAYVVHGVLLVAILELGADVRGEGRGYWGVPWTGLLLWGWLPPLWAGAMGVVGGWRRRRLVHTVVAARKDAAYGSASSPTGTDAV
jgi:hypothetical protein